MPASRASKDLGYSTAQAQPVTIKMFGDVITLEQQQESLRLTQKWVVFYTLLFLKQGEPLTIDELCDYYPWTKQPVVSAGREIWRFVQQEKKVFGYQITSSPPKQGTKVFVLRPDTLRNLRFEPNKERIADHLHNLRSYRNSQAVRLSQLNLMMQSGHVEESLRGLQELKKEALSLNDLAHTEVLITTGLDRLYGIYGTAQQIEILQRLDRNKELSRSNQARILVRLARHFTLSGRYDEASSYFDKLKKMVGPDDGLEFCQYHINYGLYLRRIGEIEKAINHTLIAHENAHIVEWWYGVQATQSNLALMYCTLGENSEGAAQQMYYEKAREWAIRGRDTTAITTQGEDEADIPLLLGHIHRKLGEYNEARRYLQQGLQAASRIPSYQDWGDILAELSALEADLGHEVAAQETLAQAEEIRRRQREG